MVLVLNKQFMFGESEIIKRNSRKTNKKMVTPLTLSKRLVHENRTVRPFFMVDNGFQVFLDVILSSFLSDDKVMGLI